MSTRFATDLRVTPPRSGHDRLGGWAWLARLADKVRAEQAGSAGEYEAYCPLSMGFLERTAISRDTFDELVRQGASDSDLMEYFDRKVSVDMKNDANRWVLVSMGSQLDEQDREEGRLAA